MGENAAELAIFKRRTERPGSTERDCAISEAEEYLFDSEYVMKCELCNGEGVVDWITNCIKVIQ